MSMKVSDEDIYIKVNKIFGHICTYTQSNCKKINIVSDPSSVCSLSDRDLTLKYVSACELLNH